MADLVSVLNGTKEILNTLQNQIPSSEDNCEQPCSEEEEDLSSSNVLCQIFDGFTEREVRRENSTRNQFQEALQRLLECITVTKIALRRHPEMNSIRLFQTTIEELYNNVLNYLRGSVMTQVSTVKLLMDRNTFWHSIRQQQKQQLNFHDSDDDHDEEQNQTRKLVREENQAKFDENAKQLIPNAQLQSPISNHSQSDYYDYQIQSRNEQCQKQPNSQDRKCQWMQQFQIILNEASKLLKDVPENVNFPQVSDFLEFFKDFLGKNDDPAMRSNIWHGQLAEPSQWSPTMINMYNNFKGKYENCTQIRKLQDNFQDIVYQGEQNLRAIPEDANYQRRDHDRKF